MYNMAVVGNRETILAFKAVGLEVFEAYHEDEARKIVDTLADKNYGIIFITEKIAEMIPDTIDRYNSSPTPAIILIPDNKGSRNIGMDRIYKNVEKAVGSNIL